MYVYMYVYMLTEMAYVCMGVCGQMFVCVCVCVCVFTSVNDRADARVIVCMGECRKGSLDGFGKGSLLCQVCIAALSANMSK